MDRTRFFLWQREIGARIGWHRADYFQERSRRYARLNEWELQRKNKLSSRIATRKRRKRFPGTKYSSLISRIDSRISRDRKRIRVAAREISERWRLNGLQRRERRLQRRLARRYTSYIRRQQRLTDSLIGFDGSDSAGAGKVKWREELPVLHDYDAAFSPVIDTLAPDVVHAHDIHLLGVAARAVGRAYVGGRRPILVYDAHEYIQGLSTPSPSLRRAWSDLEREYISRADRIITVSPPLAELLAEEYITPVTPDVVMNVPDIDYEYDRPSIRETLGLSGDVPLVVYSGGVSEGRGVHTLVEAVGMIGGIHLAVVSRAKTHYVQRLIEMAEGGGFADRFDVIPFVEPRHVVPFLSTATLAVHPMQSGPLNHQIALPNKLFEYMHAGLPVVVSDCKAMAEFVRRHEIGEVFHSGDAESLATQIKAVLHNVALDEEAYRAGGDVISRFSWDSQSQILKTIYREILATADAG